MKDLAQLCFNNTSHDLDDVKLILKNDDNITYIFNFNDRSDLISVMCCLQEALTIGSTTVTITDPIEATLEYNCWRATLYVIEQWYHLILNDEFDQMFA